MTKLLKKAETFSSYLAMGPLFFISKSLSAAASFSPNIFLLEGLLLDIKENVRPLRGG